MTIHYSGETIFSFTHIDGITLGAGEEVDEVVGGASGMCVNTIIEICGKGRSQGWDVVLTRS